MAVFCIGWSETDITPKGTVDLYGQYYHRVSGGIHSRLAATVLALESPGHDCAVMVSMDLAGAPAGFQQELRAMLQRELPELDGARIILNATHTHNAPGVNPITGISWLTELPDVTPAAEYRRFVMGKVKDAVIIAWRSRNPGGIARALSYARVGHCRRAVYLNGSAEMYGHTNREDFQGMEGGEDSGVDLLFTFDAHRQPTGVILNLACPSQVMEATYKVSSDFIGEARRLLQQRFGPDFRVLAQISAAGCQSPRDLTRNYQGEPDFWHEDGVAEIGQRLEAAIVAVLPRAIANVDFSPVLCHSVSHIALPRRRASHAGYLAAQTELTRLETVLSELDAYARFCDEVRRNEKITGRPGPYDSKLHHFVLIQNSKAVIARYQDQDQRPELEMELHVVRLGNAVFVTNPFELFLDFGHRIKARSVAGQTFVVQLCSGDDGYVPSPRAEQLGGYGGLIINGEVGADGGARLVDLTINAISTLWK